ncbi:hypothetical protein IKQ_05316 [Bacillus cereus VDM053]|nr:hypothetical protein IKQ_05316 [Bacillus cereus VDM053]
MTNQNETNALPPKTCTIERLILYRYYSFGTRLHEPS